MHVCLRKFTMVNEFKLFLVTKVLLHLSIKSETLYHTSNDDHKSEDEVYLTPVDGYLVVGCRWMEVLLCRKPMFNNGLLRLIMMADSYQNQF